MAKEREYVVFELTYTKEAQFYAMIEACEDKIKGSKFPMFKIVADNAHDARMKYLERRYKISVKAESELEYVADDFVGTAMYWEWENHLGFQPWNSFEEFLSLIPDEELRKYIEELSYDLNDMNCNTEVDIYSEDKHGNTYVETCEKLPECIKKSMYFSNLYSDILVTELKDIEKTKETLDFIL